MKTFLLTLVMFTLAQNILAQNTLKACADKSRVESLIAEAKTNKKNIDASNRNSDPAIRTFPFCWHGCAVSLVLPQTSSWFKTGREHDLVKVRAVSNEEGKIVGAKVISGPKILRRPALEAACNSQFKPVVFDSKPVKFLWEIVYNFIRN